MSEKISVIVPIYNVEKYLKNCVDCLVNQTYDNLEIILVDDGSPDNSPQICDELEKNDDRIIVLHKPNGGVSSARNLGIENATGDYVSFIDPDDVIPKEYYSILISNIGDADCSLCKFEEFSNDINFDIKSDYSVETLNQRDAIFKGLYRHPEIFYVVWNKLIKYDIVKDFRFDETMKNGEDSVFAFDTIMKCEKVSYIDLPLYGYYMRADGAVKQMDAIGMMNIMKMAYHIFTSCKNTFDKELINRAREMYVFTLVSTYSKLRSIRAKSQMKTLKREVFKYTFVILSIKKITLKEKLFVLLTYWL